MDDLSPEQRSKNMRHIRSKDTEIELILRKALWREGIRYRKNYNKLPGKPDIAITKYKIAIFCDGEFFHGKDWDQLQVKLKNSNNSEYWLKKIQRNITRDYEVEQAIRAQGWIVLRFWGKDIKKDVSMCVKAIKEAIQYVAFSSYDDFCAMVFAQKAHNKDLDRFFSKGIYNYRHVFNPETGFMQGKLRNGHWDPTFKAIKWGDPFTEANAWQYTWSVLHDIQGLIELMGGKERFVQKLDSLFHPSNNAIDVGSYSVMIHEMNEMLLVDMGQYAHGNQPVQHIPYLYNYVGMPWKTQYLVRKIMDKLYSSSIDGFCGDEDEGQMSAWYVISALGIYAVCPGTDEYVLGSPLFPKVTIHLENGKKFVIKAKGNDMHRPYIKHARLNGKPYTKNYICYKDIMLGGELELVMSEIPNTLRGIYVEDLPFSLSKENYSK